jgi:paraquat-inducible protein B
VKFLGVEVGEVTDVRLRLSEHTNEALIPVFIAIDEDLIRHKTGAPVDLSDPQEIMETIGRGLRGRLETASILTGQRYVALELEPSTPAHFLRARLPNEPEEPPEIPTLPTRLQEFTQDAAQFLSVLRTIDVEGLVADLSAASKALAALVSSPEAAALPGELRGTLDVIEELSKSLTTGADSLSEELERALHSAQPTLESLERLTARLEGDAGPLLESLRATLEHTRSVELEAVQALRTANALLAGEGPLVVQLRATLEELGAASRALRALAEALERDPSALLRGKDTTR